MSKNIENTNLIENKSKNESNLNKEEDIFHKTLKLMDLDFPNPKKIRTISTPNIIHTVNREIKIKCQTKN